MGVSMVTLGRPMPLPWPFRAEPTEWCTMCSWAWHQRYGFAVKYANRGCSVHGRLLVALESR